VGGAARGGPAGYQAPGGAFVRALSAHGARPTRGRHRDPFRWWVVLGAGDLRSLGPGRYWGLRVGFRAVSLSTSRRFTSAAVGLSCAVPVRSLYSATLPVASPAVAPGSEWLATLFTCRNQCAAVSLRFQPSLSRQNAGARAVYRAEVASWAGGKSGIPGQRYSASLMEIKLVMRSDSAAAYTLLTKSETPAERWSPSGPIVSVCVRFGAKRSSV